MFIEKTFEVTLTISNPINYCINKYQHVMTDLNNSYKNRCYLGTYIMEILDIIQISSCRIVNTNSSADGIIDIRFIAKVYVLNTWDILVGVQIEKNQSLVIGKYKKNNIEVNITFTPTNIQSTLLKLKQYVPIRVIRSIHKPMHEHISAACLLLTCDKKNLVYKIKGEIPSYANNEIKHLLELLKDELKERSKLMLTKQKEILFFESLLYYYKNNTDNVETVNVTNDITYTSYKPKQIDQSGTESIHNILDIVNKDLTGYWSKSLDLYKSSPFIKLLHNKPQEYILSLPHIAIIEILKSIINYLNVIKEFTIIYNTDELINSHENIWNMMKNNQT
jgi:hypothetical protein